MRQFLPAMAALLLMIVSSSQQLELSSLNPVKKITQVFSDIKPEAKADSRPLFGGSENGSLSEHSEGSDIEIKIPEEVGDRGALSSVLPFETKYYTDYYSGPDKHKMFREVVSTVTKKRVHCTYVGDRDIVAGLIGASNVNSNEALKAVLPTSFVTAMNVSTDEVDDLIDDCIKNPVEVPAATKPLLEKFITKITQGAKNIAGYMFIFPGTKWCGAGDVARAYGDLGPQSATDMCCRDHDHSNESLSRGENLEGLKNPLFYTMTNCDDDSKFQQCLRDAETAHAGAVGTMFFNLLKTKCFAKRKEATCVEKKPLSPCQQYTYNENTEEKYQIFDPTKFLPKSNVVAQKVNDFLFTVPGIDNVLKLF